MYIYRDGQVRGCWPTCGSFREWSEDNSAKNSLPVVTDGECFNLYQLAVPERAFEGRVREQFEQGITLQGPIWYNFSHRRWKIVWAIVDLPDLSDWIDPLNPIGPSESLGTGSVGSSLLRELDVEYRTNPREAQQQEEQRCWVQLQDLSRIPLPRAFRAIVEDLTN